MLSTSNIDKYNKKAHAKLKTQFKGDRVQSSKKSNFLSRHKSQASNKGKPSIFKSFKARNLAKRLEHTEDATTIKTNDIIRKLKEINDMSDALK